MTLYEEFMQAVPSWDDEQQGNKWVWEELQKIWPGKRVLDAGAGMQIHRKACKHLIYFTQDFCEYNGEGNNEGLQRKGWKNPPTDYVCDIEDMKIVPSHSFDVVICTNVFEHIPHPERALKEFRRVLKKDGILLLTAPFTSETHFAPYHYSTGFSKYWYEYLLPTQGFNIITINAVGDYWSVHRTASLRGPSIMRKYGKLPLVWVLTIPPALLIGIYYSLLKTTCRSTSEQLCGTYLVKATVRP
jgi:ubiquinone/menaquinone biosynthesis C-methylase UbiE